MSAADFEFVEDVTSDLTFVARGRDLEELFGAAAEALLCATVERPEEVRARIRERVELSEPASDLLLLRFLNELIYLRDGRGLLLRPRRARIEGGQGEDPLRLSAELEGEPLDAERHRPACDVKAATAHGLRVARVDEGWEARVTLDV